MATARVTAFALADLPRVPRTAPADTRALARLRAGWPDEVLASLKRLGTVVVRPTRLTFGADPRGVSFAIELHGQRGRLTVDQTLGLRLVAAVMGLSEPLTIRSLGRAERGALAAIVASFVHAADLRGVRVSLQDPGPPGGEETAFLALEVSAGRLWGAATLTLPSRWLAARSGRPPARVRFVEPLVTIDLARTTLPAASFASAQAGDSVVFEGTSALPADGPWPVQIRFGASCAGAIDRDGRIRRQGPLEPDESETTMSAYDPKITAPVPNLAMSEEAARALAAAPVEIVAELGRLTVRGDELAGLIEGGVLALGARRSGQVVLRVGGRPWAEGELVAIDDELAVRITTLLR